MPCVAFGDMVLRTLKNELRDAATPLLVSMRSQNGSGAPGETKATRSPGLILAAVGSKTLWFTNITPTCSAGIAS